MDFRKIAELAHAAEQEMESDRRTSMLQFPRLQALSDIKRAAMVLQTHKHIIDELWEKYLESGAESKFAMDNPECRI